MKYQNKSKKVLKEWLLDFDASPINGDAPEVINIVKVLKSGAAGNDVSIQDAGTVAVLANNHLANNFHEAVVKEAKIVLKDLERCFEMLYEPMGDSFMFQIHLRK